MDTFTHLWDLRDPRKPILSLSAVCMSGATQVGFNRVSGNLIATAHDGDLRIWDQRKGSCPIQYITAHLARIHGINWSHEHETRLTTACQDGSVKYFDINHPRKAEAIITTDSIVWRARYTPFSNGLVTVIVPQLERGANSLLLWNNSRQTTPVCSFVGHKDVVLDFAWRPKRDSNSPDKELISWSRDQTLRVWKVNQSMQKMCATNYFDIEEDDFVIEDFNIQRSQSTTKVPVQSCSLQHEFSLLNTNIPHIDVQVLDSIKRNSQVKISANGHIVLLQVSFPLSYPDQKESPEFEYLEGTSLDQNLQLTFLKKLKAVANERVKKGRPCLEQCLRTLVTALKKTSSGREKGHFGRLQSPRLEGALSGALHDACVPFPKTSGARFGRNDLLITFACPLNTKRLGLKQQSTTPRAYAALSGGYLGNVMGTKPILYAQRDTAATALYLTDKATRNRTISQKFGSPLVVVYDASKLLTVKRELAERYMISSSKRLEMCQHNLEVAKSIGRADLIQTWSVAVMLSMKIDKLETDPHLIPSIKIFAANILQSLIVNAIKNFDIQTAAMLLVAFARPAKVITWACVARKSGDHAISASELRYPILTTPTEQPTTAIESWNLISSENNQKTTNLFDDPLSPLFQNDAILPENKSFLYDRLRYCYAEILSRWQLLVPKTKILKYISMPMLSNAPASWGDGFWFECWNCKHRVTSPSCNKCKKNLLICTYCRLPVKGMANICIKCGHGGHLLHMSKWFQNNEICASGCGCYCLLDI